MVGPVEPAAVAKVEAPLEEECADGLGPRIKFPGPISEAPSGIMKKETTSGDLFLLWIGARMWIASGRRWSDVGECQV